MLENLFKTIDPPHASTAAVTLLFWMDGTSSGQRAIIVAKVRLIDASWLIFPTGISEVAVFYSVFLVKPVFPRYTNRCWYPSREVWEHNFSVGQCTVVSKLVLVGDRKQFSSFMVCKRAVSALLGVHARTRKPLLH